MFLMKNKNCLLCFFSCDYLYTVVFMFIIF